MLLLLASAFQPGLSEVDKLSHGVRSFDNVPSAPDGLKLFRFAKQGLRCSAGDAEGSVTVDFSIF